MRLLKGRARARRGAPRLLEVDCESSGRAAALANEEIFDQRSTSEGQQTIGDDAARDHQPSAGAAIENTVHSHLLHLPVPSLCDAELGLSEVRRVQSALTDEYAGTRRSVTSATA